MSKKTAVATYEFHDPKRRSLMALIRMAIENARRLR